MDPEDPEAVAAACFEAFACLWLLSAASHHGVASSPVFWGTLGLWRRKRWPLCIGLVVECAIIIEKIPTAWPSWWWALQANAATIASLMRGSLDMATIRIQYSWFYLAAGIWKANTSFLDWRSSCATVFASQHAARYGLSKLSFLVKAAPILTLLAETSIGVCGLAGYSRAAAWTALVLHFAIATTPRPNKVATFAALCAPRLLAFSSPESLARAWRKYRHAFAIGLAALAVRDPQSRAFGVFLPSALVVAMAADRDRTRATKLWVLLALVYCFALPSTGFLDLGAPTMYANLRLHGPSNHLFLPTPSLATVAILSSNSTFVRSKYPGELDLEPVETSSLLEQLGYYAPRFFNSAKPFVLEQTSRHPLTPFTLPHAGFRRLVGSARKQREPFDLVYLTTHRVTAIFSRTGRLKSCQTDDAMPCSPADRELLLQPNSPWFDKLVFHLPYPLLDHVPEHRVLCFGP